MGRATRAAVRCRRVRAFLLDDFPVGILANYLSIPKRQQVASADANLLAGFGRSGEEPLRHGVIAEEPMLVIGIVDIRQALEARRQALADFRLADVALPARLRAARPVETFRPSCSATSRSVKEVEGMEGIGGNLRVS